MSSLRNAWRRAPRSSLDQAHAIGPRPSPGASPLPSPFPWFLILAAVLALGVARAQSPADAFSALQSDLGAFLSPSNAPGATWAAMVASASTGAVWFERDPARLMVPASNTKLFTVAMALDRFGTNGTFATEWRWPGTPDASGTLDGNAWLVAGGDPAPGGGASTVAALASLADALAHGGVRRIRGRILLVDAFFDAPPFGLGWNWDDIPEAYGAPVAGFQWADNAVTLVVEPGNMAGDHATVRTFPIPEAFDIESSVRTVQKDAPANLTIRRSPDPSSFRFAVSGTVQAGKPHMERMAVPDAGEWLARGLSDLLRQRGVEHAGIVRASGPSALPKSIPPRARVPSPPMAEIAALCLKPSNNRIAYALWLHVGADLRRNPRPSDPMPAPGTTEDDNDRAARAMDAFMGQVGVPRGDVVLEEGSGLSRKNLVTPRATIQLLRHMDSNPASSAWLSALPVGGIDGTLRSRFTGPGAKGRVLAKTGTLRHVHSLAGHVTTASGQRLVFALFVNGHAAPNATGRATAEIDQFISRLAAFAGRGPE